MLRDVGEGLVSRWLSSLLAIVSIIIAFAGGGPATGIPMVFLSLFAWCCVWFPGVMGTNPVRTNGRTMARNPVE